MHEVLTIGLLRFVKAEKERESFKILSKHAAKILEVVKKFQDVIDAFSKHDAAKAKRLMREVDAMETAADADRRKFRRLLREGAFLPVFRGDLDRLVGRIDDVADIAEDAAELVALRDKLFTAVANAEKKNPKFKSICKTLIEMSDKATKATEALKDSVDALMSDVDAASAKTKDIELFEHESDMLERELMKDLYAYEKLLDPLSMEQIREIAKLVGNISDCAEDAGDILSGLALEFKA